MTFKQQKQMTSKFFLVRTFPVKHQAFFKIPPKMRMFTLHSAQMMMVIYMRFPLVGDA